MSNFQDKTQSGTTWDEKLGLLLTWNDTSIQYGQDITTEDSDILNTEDEIAICTEYEKLLTNWVDKNE